MTAFAASPDGGRGLARDFPVRWAFEEVGQPYDVRPVSFEEMKQPPYRALQPFGQIPAYQDGDLTLFESAAIVLRIAETHDGLLPADGDARSRAIAWMFAAKATIEPYVIEREAAMLLERDKDWFDRRLPLLDQRVSSRLADLSSRIGESEWLDGGFSAADIVMINVLRRPAATGLLDDRLKAYVARGERRPAFQRAYQAQRDLCLAAAEAAAS